MCDAVDGERADELAAKSARRFRVVTICSIIVTLALSLFAFVYTSSIGLALFAGGSITLAVSLPLFRFESYEQYVTDRSSADVRADFLDETPPLLIRHWSQAAEIRSHEDSVEYVTDSADETDNVCYRVIDRSSDEIRAQVYTEKTQLFSLTVRIASDGDQTRLFVAAPFGFDASLVHLAKLFLVGTVGREFMQLQGYRQVDSRSTVSLSLRDWS